MSGTMQDWPLLVSKLIDHAAIYHAQREIVSLSCEGPKHRTNWAQVRGRAKQVAGALRRLGMQHHSAIGLDHIARGDQQLRRQARILGNQRMIPADA